MPVADSERTLRAYVDAVAARTPAPGGGSVAALAGALAAALGEMVANLSLGRGERTSSDEALEAARDRLTSLREALLEAAAADERAYAVYRVAVVMPRASPADQASRAVAMERALVDATEVPLGVARAATEVAEIMQTVARVGNPRVLSDAALGALLAETAVEGALLYVRENAPRLQDKARARAYMIDADLITEEGREAAEHAYRIATGDIDEDEAL